MSSREITMMEIGESSTGDRTWGLCTSSETDQLIQKVIAEFIGTFFLIFAGCGSVAVNKIYGSVSFPGICIVWGLIVMVMVYSVGHISGAHFNPAVTLTFAIYRHFPLKQVPLYVIAQILGSILASATLCAVFPVDKKSFFGTVPVGSNSQALLIEIIISFLLMFVISGVSTDNRAIGELAGIAVGMTITLNVFVAGPVSGASMNPARSIGPALQVHIYKGLWVYLVGPPVGTILGGLAYNLIRFTDKPLREITKSGSFLRSMPR
ncbi:probable aquaporin NIP-type [Juglans microcarpa x Juglans regia]|uniref:probable aquaporin NIP-type n=1 Tax=Juglans microcarpa x Juglans regia TaxID=2249226 RepID=UPI001B7F5F22|nr:probable aquaporin NIP-type [Juglans microcarpa x Juglans regia]